MSNDIKQEPFGYFKAEPFGWTDCAETDEGAIALYERPQPAPDVAALQARIAELERELKSSDTALIESRANDAEAMRQLNELRQHKDADLQSLRDHCKELERVQGVLVGALETVVERFSPVRKELIFSKRMAIDKAIAALAAVQKQEGGDK